MRGFSAALRDALRQQTVGWALLADLNFTSGTQRLWSGPTGHDLSWGGNTYTGIGDIGGVDKIIEAHGMVDGRTTLSLRVTSGQVATLEGEDTAGRTATIRLLFFNADGSAADEFVAAFRMGALRVRASRRDDIIEDRIELELISPAAELARRYSVPMTYEAGLQIDSADHGLEFVSHPEVGDTGPVRDRRGGGHVPGSDVSDARVFRQ